MVTFEYEGVKITLKPAIGRNRMRLNQLRRAYPGYFDLPKDEQDLVEEILNLLYLVDKVDGDLGFAVPMNGSTTPENLQVCVDGIFNAPESLYLKWVVAVHQVRSLQGNDPDLAPPDDLTDDQKKITKSKPDANNNG